jgi:hypothetical protein
MKTFTIALAFLCLGLTVIAQNPHCKATKKDGTPCRSTVILPNGYCPFHNPDTPRCGFIKKDGKPCRMQVQKPDERCRYHQDKA